MELFKYNLDSQIKYLNFEPIFKEYDNYKGYIKKKSFIF